MCRHLKGSDPAPVRRSPRPHGQLPLLRSEPTLPASAGAVFLFVARLQKHNVPDLRKHDIYHRTIPNWTLEYVYCFPFNQVTAQTWLLLQLMDNYINI